MTDLLLRTARHKQQSSEQPCMNINCDVFSFTCSDEPCTALLLDTQYQKLLLACTSQA
jgi:hypothetical protein